MQVLPIATLNQPIAVALEQRKANALASLGRNLPRFTDLERINLGLVGCAALVSGGPSVIDYLSDIRTYQTVVASGSCHDFLVDHGIVPQFCVIFDPAPDHARFYKKPQRETVYLVSSTCAPSVFDALAGFNVHVWHPFDDIPDELYNFEPRVGGGSSVTLRSIAIAHIMGLRELHLFGFDCCYLSSAEHAYPYHQDRPAPIAVNLNGQQFLTTPALLQQAQEFFRMLYDHQHVLACVIYGPGLASAMWEAGARRSYDLHA